MKLIIVGAGLFGRVAADLAEKFGHEALTIDAQMQMRASPAAGCLLKPSWLASIPKQAVERGLSVLDELYGLEDVELKSTLGFPVWVRRVDPDKILKKKPDVVGRVVGVSQDGQVRMEDGTVYRGTVLVAAGVWSKELVPSMPDIKVLVGASARFPGQLPGGRIDIYAPYRQAVAFNINKKQTWFGDGTSIVQHNWSDERVEQSADRAAAKFSLHGGRWTVGARPYVEGHKAGYLKQVGKKLYVSTGGAKNGITLAASQAFEFLGTML